MQHQRLLKLACVDAISIIALMLFAVVQVQAQYILAGGSLWGIQTMELGQLLSSLLSNIHLFFCPIFALLHAYAVYRMVSSSNKSRLVALNGVVCFAISLFVCYILFVLKLIPFFSFGSFLFLPFSILCILITQVLLAILFLRQDRGSENVNWKTFSRLCNNALFGLPIFSRYWAVTWRLSWFHGRFDT